MKVEKLSVENWDEYANWWYARSFVPPASDIIPATSFMVRDDRGVGICAGSVYVSEGAEIAWVSWVVTNPAYDIMKRRRAMNTLVEAIVELANERGCRQVFTSTENPALGRIYQKCGFLTGDDEATHYFRRIR